MTDEIDTETAEILTALVKSPLMREMLKESSPSITDEIIDNLRIVPRSEEEPEYQLPEWIEQ